MSVAKNSDKVKPKVLEKKALFMWEIIASFSKPFTVLTLESLCHDVRRVLSESSKGTRLMQRYWKVQYERLLWDEETITFPQRTLNFTLSTREKNCSWRNMYRDEYPFYIKRVFQGLGTNNNSINAAKVFFKVKPVNNICSGEELAKMQLTPLQALKKHIMKNKLSNKNEKTNDNNNNKNNNDNNDDSGDNHIGGSAEGNNNNNNKSSSSSSVGTNEEMKKNQLPCDKKRFLKQNQLKQKDIKRGKGIILRESSTTELTRVDYVSDRRLQKYKGKHKKGGTRKWEQSLDDNMD